ncbi:MAG: type II toxin-antitoxin system VapC family toxin [Acidobacteriaceae bacterium]|nr:type II toxin-antitoxin system VapC family toxin [Acidobacteriaceae bacterium]
MYLLDTHSFLWFLWDDPKLFARVRRAIQEDTPCYVSMCSLWEISIKVSLNKLTLPGPYRPYIPQQLQINQFNILPIEFRHTARQSLLPRYHGDPFDRMLIAQSIEENLILISRDAKFAPYGIPLLW